MPKLELVERAPGDLGFPARKLRKVEPAHVLEVANAISSLGFCDPVLIDEQNGVLDGIVRVEAAKLLGLPHIPCIRANHLSASERRLVRMALNRLGEKGSWHFDELKLELEELILEDVPIEIAGFSMLEVDQIIAGEEPAAVEAGPLAPELVEGDEPESNTLWAVDNSAGGSPIRHPLPDVRFSSGLKEPSAVVPLAERSNGRDRAPLAVRLKKSSHQHMLCIARRHQAA